MSEKEKELVYQPIYFSPTLTRMVALPTIAALLGHAPECAPYQRGELACGPLWVHQDHIELEAPGNGGNFARSLFSFSVSSSAVALSTGAYHPPIK